MRNGVEFTLVLIEPGLWRWRFQIGETATTGTTTTNLRRMAARRVKTRIAPRTGKAAQTTLVGNQPINEAVDVAHTSFRVSSESHVERIVCDGRVSVRQRLTDASASD